MFQSAPYSRHAGLGTPNAAQNITPANAPVAEKYSLFIGNISTNLEDYWLEKILATAGNLTGLNRIKDANGIPKAFGFAEYADADSVLRCLDLLHNVNVPGKTPADTKPLQVKADAKTRARLDAFEATQKSKEAIDRQQEAMEAAQNALRGVVDEMVLTGNAESPEKAVEREAEEARKRSAALHLKDLGPDELPPESRELITREIDLFRERAAKREADRKAAQAAADAAKVEQHRNAVLRQGGYSNIAPSNSQNSRNNAQSAYANRNNDTRRPNEPRQNNDFRHQNQSQQDRGMNFVRSNGTGIGENGRHPENGRSRRDYSDRDSRDREYRDRDNERSSQSRREPDENDPDIPEEEAERIRAARIKCEAEFRYRDKERQWDSHERQRQSNNDREKARDNALQRDEDAQRMNMAAKLAEWCDAEEIDRGKELFHVDRPRWRAQRKAFRNREIEQDARDAEQEAAQLAMLDKASTDFLSGVFAKDGPRKRQTGTPAAEETGPIKVAVHAPTKKAEPKPTELPKPKASAFGAIDETEGVVKRKRELITLTYSDDEEDAEEVGLTDREKQERRSAKLKSLVEKVPTEQAGLWAWEVRWDKLTEATLVEKIAPFASKKVAEALGTEEEELVAVCVEHIRAHKSAADLVEELEPVLADEAVEFVIKLWRMLVFETLAATHRVKTSAV